MSVPSKVKDHVLTEKQEKFLSVLFNEAEGDPAKAKKLAGYSDYTTTFEVLSSLREEIIQMSKDILAMNAPRAALSLVDSMVNPTGKGAGQKMRAAQDILDRVGLSVPKGDNIQMSVPQGGLFILPAKEIKIVEEKIIEGEIIDV